MDDGHIEIPEKDVFASCSLCELLPLHHPPAQAPSKMSLWKLGGTSESLDSCEPAACKEATISSLFELTSGEVEVSCCRVLGGLIQRKDPFLCRRSHALIQPGLDPLKTAA